MPFLKKNLFLVKSIGMNNKDKTILSKTNTMIL